MAARSRTWMLVELLLMMCTLTSCRATCDTANMEKLWNGSICMAEDGCHCGFSLSRMNCAGNLLQVNLQGCEIFSLAHFTSNYSSSFPDISYLNLSYNSIRKVKAGLFSKPQFKRLHTLDMTFNWDCYSSQLFENGVFKGLDELKVLSLSLKNPKEEPSCLASGNFTLDSLSTLSLSRNLTELHVTGSPYMEGLDQLPRLSTLNLGGNFCSLTSRSNLHLLSNLSLYRVSLRNCTTLSSSLLRLEGVVSLLQSAVYLDLSCSSITFESVFCELPLGKLKVLMLDQHGDTFRSYYFRQCAQSRSINLTAVSFEGYKAHADFRRYVPSLNSSVFPQLTHLSIAKSTLGMFLDDIQHIMDARISHLQYLQFLDVSDIGTATQAFCPYSGAQYHPWFMSKDLHKVPSLSSHSSCLHCQGFPLLPRLKTLQARNSPSFALDLTNTCQFQPNSLTQLDISEAKFTPSKTKCPGGFKGLDRMSTLHATEIDDADLNFLFSTFPNLTYLDISGAAAVSSLFRAHHTNLKVLKIDRLPGNLFPNSTVDADVGRVLPSLQTLSLANNNLVSFRMTLPFNLTSLKLRNNKIQIISSDARQNFTRHFQNMAQFHVDLVGNPIICDCPCEGLHSRYFSWLLESKFVSFGEQCDGKSEYRDIAECVDVSRQTCPTVAPSMPIDSIIGIAVAGALVVIAVVVGFFIYRRYRWRIGFWISEKFQRLQNNQRNQDGAKVFYLSYCKGNEMQAEGAFELWNYAKGDDVGDITLTSRYDIGIGAWTNQAITKMIRSAHGVLLLMPDGEYSNDDGALYEFQLAIRFHKMENIHPIIKEGTGGIEDISDRIPPLLPAALRPYCLDIYPPNTEREAINEFFVKLRLAVCELPPAIEVDIQV